MKKRQVHLEINWYFTKKHESYNTRKILFLPLKYRCRPINFSTDSRSLLWMSTYNVWISSVTWVGVILYFVCKLQSLVLLIFD